MKIRPGFIVGILSLGGLFGFSVWASNSGFGVAKPAKKAMSIREGSVRTSGTSSGRHRTRYFVGGGLHRGK